MSRTTIHAISEATGRVRSFADVKNGVAFFEHVWHTLAEKYGTGTNYGTREALWSLLGTPRMADEDSVVMGSTFDRVWVRRENIAKLTSALRSFWSRHSRMRDQDGKLYDVTPAIPEIADNLDELSARKGVRGACFSLSLSDNLWWVPIEGRHGFDRGHMFVFGKDTVCCDGGTPLELFDRLRRPS